MLRFGIAALLAAFAAGAAAADVHLQEQAFYPEGPTYIRGALYWAEMPAHRIRRHRDGKTTTVWEQPGCGPTSIKPDGRGGFWILCHLAHMVLRVDGDFRLLKRLETDGVGRRLAYPNDATVDRRGQLYFTSSGVFSLSAPSEGAVYFVDLQDQPLRIAEGLRYANGIRLDEKHARLYVSEHLARRVLVMDVAKPGEVGAPSVTRGARGATSGFPPRRPRSITSSSNLTCKGGPTTITCRKAHHDCENQDHRTCRAVRISGAAGARFASWNVVVLDE